MEWLCTLGWPLPLQACSGNGWHLLYRIDLPNDDTSRTNIEFALKTLSYLFSTDKINVDTTVFNASRVWKIYGTISAKGSHTSSRPHRVATIREMPEELILVDPGKIDHLASGLRDAKSDEFKDYTGEYISDMVKWLSDRGQTVVSGPRPMFGNEGQKWIISRCPFNPSHAEPMVGLVANRPVFRCLHNSCSAFKWKEFREKIDPTYKDPDTVEKRLVDWCNGNDQDMDEELSQAVCVLGNKVGDQILRKVRKEVQRDRFVLLESIVKAKRRQYLKDTIGDNNEKGNLVGLINRTIKMQADGIVPNFWEADYDHRVRVGTMSSVDSPKLDETHEIELMVRFHSLGDSWVKQTHAGQVIRYIAAQNKLNPLKQMLKDKKWDGRHRLSNWLPHYMGTEDSEYTRAIGRKWMISAVARAMDPGCQVDHMLVFEGAQGCGKSSAARILGGRFYTEYTGDFKNAAGIKDMVHVIIGKMVVELSEMSAIKRTEMEAIKAILTTTVDDVRLSYERDAKSYPRTCVFIGSTNKVGQPYIPDDTGARRFWPTIVAKEFPIKLNLLKEDVDQLWAEAVEAYEDGEDWHTVPQEAVAHEQLERQMTVRDSDPWHHRILGSLTDPDSYAAGAYSIVESGDKSVVSVTNMSAVLGIILGIDPSRQTSIDLSRTTNILKSIGFVRVKSSRKIAGMTPYELPKESIIHLWPAIELANKSVKFPEQKQTSGS